MVQMEVATVLQIQSQRPGLQEIQVEIDGQPEAALNYPQISGEVKPGDRVLVNTMAVRVGLGTGGHHFVVAILGEAAAGRPEGARAGREAGHIMKLRYTPVQLRCLSVEEPASPYRDQIEAFRTLEEMPVVVAPLHSMIAPIAAAVKAATEGRARIAYLMTDTAALPLAFSRLVQQLKEAGLIDSTITVGQAFGGDYEAVNVYTGLIAAQQVGEAQVAIVCQGPGNVGTGTEYGFGATYQGEVLNAAKILGGIPIAALRISFADPRPRHQGVSQQSLTVLSKIALLSAVVAVPQLDAQQADSVMAQIADRGIDRKHTIEIEDGSAGITEAERLGIPLVTMGRGVDQDREFFLAAGSAGAVAAKRIKWQKND